MQVSVPQHCDEDVQAVPWPLQPLEPTHTCAELQVKVPQHWEEEEQPAPWPPQPEEPWQWPETQDIVPQHWEEDVHAVPWPWQELPPPVQTWLLLQVRTPQQSPEDEHDWFCCWQGPVMSGGGGSGSEPPPQASARTIGTARSAIRRAVFVFPFIVTMLLQN